MSGMRAVPGVPVGRGPRTQVLGLMGGGAEAVVGFVGEGGTTAEGVRMPREAGGYSAIDDLDAGRIRGRAIRTP